MAGPLNPSHLKVQRLIELDAYPGPGVDPTWMYAVQGNTDYKVGLEPLVEDIADAVTDVVYADLQGPGGASLIGIQDAGGYFAFSNVEGALQEIGAIMDPFDPTADYTLSGNITLTQPLTAADISAEDVLADSVASPLVRLVEGVDTGTLQAPALSASRTYSFPDATGTVALTSNIPAQVNLVAGSNINITGSYPNLTISGAGGGGGGSVTSVNTQVGDVILDYTDVGAAAAVHSHSDATTSVAGFLSAADKTKLDGIASGATANAGTVTSVGMSVPTGLQVSGSPITSSGTLAMTYQAGYVGYTITEQTKLSGIAPGATANSGTVTSVNVSGSTGISFTGGPVTTSGTITGTLSANLQSWSSVSTGSVAMLSGASFSGAISATNISASGIVTSNDTFTSSGSSAVLSTTGAGVVYLRPNGAGSGVGQGLLNSLGQFTIEGNSTAANGARLQLRTMHASGSPGVTFTDAGGAFRGGMYWDSPTDSVDFYTSQDGGTPRVRLTGPGRLQTVSGLGVNDTIASGIADLTKHIDLYGGIYGFCITGNTLNHVVPDAAKHSFIVNSAERARIDGTGLGDFAASTGTIVNVRDAPVWYINNNINLAQTYRGSAFVKADSTARTITIQPNSSIAIGIGMMMTFANVGGQTNNLTIARGSGVALWRNGTNADIVLAPGHSVTILKIATDVWQA